MIYTESTISTTLQESPKLTQKSTQTSPENAENISVKGQFSIGCGSKEVSPKRKERSLGKIRQKRSVSPVHLHQISAAAKINYNSEPVKQAMSPLLAESLRAVFAAFLWHEGKNLAIVSTVGLFSISVVVKYSVSVSLF